MKPKTKRNRAFTIVELLTVMSIIVILISLLVPGLNKVRQFARRVRQKAQFHSIEIALDMFSTEHDGYPDSSADDNDGTGNPYCGAMKLTEAMLGRDLMGFHSQSRIYASGEDPSGNELYPEQNSVTPEEYAKNLRNRQGPYLQLETANAFRMDHIYVNNLGDFSGIEPIPFLLCDVYTNVDHRETGKKVGMPVLYYKARPNRIEHSVSRVNDSTYDYRDNDDLVKLGMPWLGDGYSHSIYNGGGTTPSGGTASADTFYDITRNPDITTAVRPYRADSYILMSAGHDGEYGTSDDVFNFGN